MEHSRLGKEHMRTRILLGLLVAGLCVFTVGCGGGDGNASDTSSDTSSDNGSDATSPDGTTTPDGVEEDIPTLPPPPVGPVIDLRADSNRNGLVDMNDATEDELEEQWNTESGAVFLANLDDDMMRCETWGTDVTLPQCFDAADDVVNGAEDLLDMAPLKIAAWADAGDDVQATLSVSPDAGASRVRLFIGNDGTYSNFDWTQQSLNADQIRAGVDFMLEGKDIVRNTATWDGYIDITLTVTDGAGEVGTDTVRMRVSPLMLFHHAEDTVTAYISPGNGSNAGAFTQDMNNAFTAAGGDAELINLPVSDQWTQDYFETGYMTMPGVSGGKHVIHVSIRSANVFSPNDHSNPLRPAGKVIYSMMRKKDMGIVQQFDINHDGNMDSLNSFGNTETIPPHSFNGADYPLGRILRGSIPSYHPDPTFSLMLESQAVQPPVYIDTSFLLVSHVDEIFSFLPVDIDFINERGWIMLVNDAVMAKEMLEDLQAQGHGDVPMFENMWWDDHVEVDTGQSCQSDSQCDPSETCLTKAYQGQGTKCHALCETNADCAPGQGCKAAYMNQNVKVCHAESAQITISQVLNDTDVMAESLASAQEVEANLDIIKAETGITEAEIVRIPYLHHSIYGYSVAYQPGTVNGMHLKKGHFLPPDPHGPVIGGVDVMKQQMEDALAPYNYTMHWVEDWNLYHRMLGEVHCGSNARRTIPTSNWWESGR
jgi:protein-arginine deiminase